MGKRFTWILAGAAALMTGGAMWAGIHGLGATPPLSQPISIREGSLGKGAPARGRAGTAFFAGRALMGGGLRGGK